MTDGDTAYVTFRARINPGSTDALLKLCTGLVADGVGTVYLMISSPGGSVENAIATYNLLRGMPFRLITHNVASIKSMGLVLFLAGEERYACSASSFMFHDIGFNVGAKTRFDRNSLGEKLGSLKSDHGKTLKILCDRTGLDGEQIDALLREGATHGPDYAKQHGIIHEIREIEIPAGARVHHLPAKRGVRP